MKGIFGIIGLVLLIIALIIIGPLLIIWSLNTLFGLEIAFTFWNWLATLFLSGVFKTTINKK